MLDLYVIQNCENGIIFLESYIEEGMLRERKNLIYCFDIFIISSLFLGKFYRYYYEINKIN